MMKKFLVLALALYTLFGISGTHAKKNDRSLVIGIAQEFENLNPTIAQMAASTYMYYLVGQPLITLNADWKWECVLCKRIPLPDTGLMKVKEENGQEHMYTEWEIFEDAKWGDGKPITGYDVQFSWQVGKSPNVSVGLKDVYERMLDVIVDKKNPKKFTIKFDKPRYGYWQLGTFYVLPKHLEGPIFEKAKSSRGAYEKQSMYSVNPTHPGLYSGPYRVKEIKLGSHVVLVPNEKYNGPKTNIDSVIFRLIPNTQALEANLLSGTINMIGELGITFDQALALEKRLKKDERLRKKFEVLYRAGTVYEHVDLNLRNNLLQDVRLRRALLFAIDRQSMVDALFEGRQKVAIHSLHPYDPYYTEDVEKYPYNPEMAKKLLDEAGWKTGSDGIRVKDGKRLSISIMSTAQNKTRENVEVFLQNQFKKVGVDLKIKNQPARVFFGETVRKGLYPDLAMFAWISSPDNPPKSTLYSGEIPTKENGHSGQNSGAYRNKLVDESLDKLETEMDMKVRRELMKTVMQEYMKDVPVLPLYMRAQIAVIPKRLEGFRLSGHQFYSTLGARNWKMK
jgi:peptide/nickel transport system substrate-binding protein